MRHLPSPALSLVMLVVLVIGSLLAALLSACGPALNWREVKPPQSDGLAMVFPCKPDAHERSVRLPGLAGNTPQRVHLLACRADGITWAVSYFTTESVEQRGQALAALKEALWANTAPPASAQARQQALGPAKVPGMTPHPDARVWWMQGERPASTSEMQPVQLKAWHFSHGLTVFQATASAETLQGDDPRLEAFEQGLTFQP